MHRTKSGTFEEDEDTEVSASAPLVDFDNAPDGQTGPTAETDMATLPETRTAAQRTLATLADQERRKRYVRDGSAPLRRSATVCTMPPREARDSRSMASPPTVGVKYDSEKSRFSLVPLKALRAVVRVLDAGARKYAPDNWKKVENTRRRYYDAAQRHIFDWYELDDRADPETGEHPLAHAICCLLFLLAIDLGLDS